MDLPVMPESQVKAFVFKAARDIEDRLHPGAPLGGLRFGAGGGEGG